MEEAEPAFASLAATTVPLRWRKSPVKSLLSESATVPEPETALVAAAPVTTAFATSEPPPEIVPPSVSVVLPTVVKPTAPLREIGRFTAWEPSADVQPEETSPLSVNVPLPAKV